jgi:hypothetical protein
VCVCVCVCGTVHVRNLDHVIEMLGGPVRTHSKSERLYVRDRTVLLTRVPSYLSHEGCIGGLEDEWTDS